MGRLSQAAVAYFRRFIFSPVSTIKYRVITFFLHPPRRPHGSRHVCARERKRARCNGGGLSFATREKNGGNHRTLATQICAAAAIFRNELLARNLLD
jgi:hypothetical protein